MTTDSASMFRRLINWTTLRARPGYMAVKRRASPGARDSLLALVDQAVVSGGNFLTALVLARYLSPVGYGHYVLLFSVLLFINGIQTALITAPLMVLAPRYDAQGLPGYFNALWVIQMAGCIVAGAAVALLALVAGRWWPEFVGQVAVVPLVLATSTYLIQEFVRRMLFAQRDSVGGMVLDTLSYGLQFAALVGLIVGGLLTLDTTIWAIGLTSLVSCIFGAVRTRPTLHTVGRADLAKTWREHWDQGRWLTGGTLAQWVAGQIHFFIVAAMISPAATGLLAASRNLLGFAHIFTLGLENFAPSMAARHLMNGGVDAMVRWVSRFRLMLTTLIGVYCLLVVVFAGPLMRLVFGSQYEGATGVVAILAVFTFLLALNRPSMIGLRALGEPRWLFFAHLISALATLALVVPLVSLLGVVGAALCQVVIQLVVLAVANGGYMRVLRRARAAAVSQRAEAAPELG